ncbi:MAG: hypothetical protein K8I82_01245, partial [Anaerolineae bacterium]|nr:hypothetical protein [Anaerolineae bacterium]
FYNHISGHSQVMFRREAALKVGGYDESLPYSQDYDLWLRLLASGEIAMLPRTWLQWRTHQENISTQKFAQQEHLSLSLSQRELSRLLGRALDLETAAYLRGFWLEPFPPISEAGNIHRLLREVYRKMFLYKDKRWPVGQWYKFTGLKSGVSPVRLHGEIAPQHEIKKAVAERFFRWARSVSLRQHPLTKLKLWFYAWRWTCTGN